jgi:hypothetical protein
VTNRRDFLERLAAGAALAAGASTLTAEPAAASPSTGPLVQGTETWDTSWTTKISGSHRAVFDATEIEDGAGLFRAMIWRFQYSQVLKVSPNDMTAVLVIRHSAIPLAMNQEYWDRYRIGKAKKVKHPFTEKPTSKNPVLFTVDSGDLPKEMATLNLAGLQASGGVVLACNLAFAQCVGTVAKAEKVDGAEARKRAIAMLNPGVILQPSGVFATILAQESGCQYIKAS